MLKKKGIEFRRRESVTVKVTKLVAVVSCQIRDTSVLVRLRPAWEDLRSYLIAKGRKRFEVYVCTMAERDYALEMWRLLDPEAHLIGPNQRVVCVKSDSKCCSSSVVARNVACNVREGFFKEFDENILRRISDLFYEDEVASLPAAPDASNYMMSEDASFVLNGSASAPMAEGMHGPEVVQRLNHLKLVCLRITENFKVKVEK